MRRIAHVIRKEFIQIKRDKWLLRMVAIAPLFQLVIYGYVVATEILALPMVVLDYSPSTETRRLVDRFVSSGYFILEHQAASLSEVTKQLDSGRSLVAVVIPEVYTENVRRGVRATVQLLVDGTNSNTASIALGYASGIIQAE